LTVFYNPDSGAKEYEIGIKIEKNAPAGRLQTKIKIITDSQEDPPLVVPIFGLISH